MNETDFVQIVRKIVDKDPRYNPSVYSFMREAVDFTVKALDKPAEGPGRHISGVELLDGIRRFTLQEFGPMSLTVLKEWGVMSTSDFGEIVFNLVECGVLGKTEKDSRDDFADIYDFTEVFSQPFIPEKPLELKVKKADDKRSSKESTASRGNK